MILKKKRIYSNSCNSTVHLAVIFYNYIFIETNRDREIEYYANSRVFLCPLVPSSEETT